MAGLSAFRYRVHSSRLRSWTAAAYLLTLSSRQHHHASAFSSSTVASSIPFLIRGGIFSPQKQARAHSIIQTTRLLSSKFDNDNINSNTISISDKYDGGNIEHSGTSSTTDKSTGTSIPRVSLNIKPDPYTELEEKEHFQYFSFRSTVGLDNGNNNNGESNKSSNKVQYCLKNAGRASYAGAWQGYTVCYSTQLNRPDSWRRVLDTKYNPQLGTLTWTHDHASTTNTGSGSVYFAYYPPFSYQRHLDLVEKCSQYASMESLGQTLDGREIECFTIGTGSTVGWIIHQQHPGEHMAEFYAEGLLTRLLGLDAEGQVDGLVHQLLQKYTFHVVPNMNPDGAARGHLRTNAAGANLNREWASSPEKDYEAPSLKRSPEVYHVLKKMDETGCDLFLDVHGDEGLPYNFLAQAGVPQWGPRLEALHGAFLASYSRTNPDMQQKIAYEAPPPFQDGDVLNIASDQVAARFDCLSLTLEMPFKDCLSNPDPERGWSPARARKLGASVLDSFMHIQPHLRADGEFWKSLPKEDAYVLPTSDYK